jgi:hypothetical protein
MNANYDFKMMWQVAFVACFEALIRDVTLARKKILGTGLQAENVTFDLWNIQLKRCLCLVLELQSKAN